MSVCKRAFYGARPFSRKDPRLILIDAAALAGFLLFGLLFTRPLWRDVSGSIVGRVGDNIYFIWLTGWFKKAYFSLGVDPMNVGFLNYPAGWSLASTEIAPAQLALAVPFALIGGETFGYNAAMLLSFALSGWICYLWLTSLSGSRLAGFIAGGLFACLPYRQAHFLAGHLNLSGTQWIPLFFWGWLDLLNADSAARSANRRAAWMAALGLGLTALCSQYYVFMVIFIAGALFLITLLIRRGELIRSVSFWKSLGLTLLLSLPLLVVAELPFLALDAAGGMPDRDISSVRPYSASLSDFLLPATTHFAFGNWIGARFNRDLWIESTLYIGIIAASLFIFGAIRRDETARTRRLWTLLILGVFVSALLAMGTDLHWNERPLEIPLPAFLAERFGRETVPLLLPGYFLFKYFPFYAKIRAMMRFGLFSGFFIAVGAGLGAAALLNRFNGRARTLLFAALFALCLADFYPKAAAETAEIAPRPVAVWLSGQSDHRAVMRVPFYLNDDQAGTYDTLYHEKPFIGGFFNAFPTAQYREIRPVMETFPSAGALDAARSLGVGYFLIEADPDLPFPERTAVQSAIVMEAEAAGLVRLYEDETVVVMTYDGPLETE